MGPMAQPGKERTLTFINANTVERVNRVRQRPAQTVVWRPDEIFLDPNLVNDFVTDLTNHASPLTLRVTMHNF